MAVPSLLLAVLLLLSARLLNMPVLLSAVFGVGVEVRIDAVEDGEAVDLVPVTPLPPYVCLLAPGAVAPEPALLAL
jgi:hypothetical protein